MAFDKREWASSQMAQTKTKAIVGRIVMKILDAWEPVPDSVKPEDIKAAFDIAGKLVLGHALVPASTGTEIWVSVRPGQIKVGDEVRVAFDAYTGELGAIHNGRRGKVVAIRSGDIIVTTTDDKMPRLDGVHYAPISLEKKIG